MWREHSVPVDVGDHHLRALLRRAAARGAVVLDDREVLEELSTEPVLGGDPQAAFRQVHELDVPEVPADQGDRTFERPLEQRFEVR